MVVMLELPSLQVYSAVAALLRGEKILMTATRSVVQSLFLDGVDARGDIKVARREYLQMRTAIDRTASFWSDEPVDPVQADTQAAAGASWFAARSRMLARRVTPRPAGDAHVGDGPLPAAFVELRGPDELRLAHRILAEAFDSDVAEVAPRRTTIAAERLHLRTWALYRDARVLACALAVQVDNIVVVCAVATQPALRGRGYGTWLMRTLHELYERAGTVRVFLLYSSGHRCAVFEKLGYREIGSPRATAGSDTLVCPPQRAQAMPDQFDSAYTVQGAGAG